MSGVTKVPSIPAVSQANLQTVASAIKLLLDVREGRAGDPLDANVTYRDLIDAGAVRLRPGYNGRLPNPVIPPWSSPDGYDPIADLTPPPRPEGFTATGLFAVIQLQWNRPTYRNHAYTEIWRSDTNVLGNAIRIGTTDTSFYADSIGTGGTRYYWVRFVSEANVIGPYHATDGAEATTAQDPALLIASLAGQIKESELFTGLAQRINLIDAPSSVVNSVNNRIAVVQGQVNDLLNIPAWDPTETYAQDTQVTYNSALYIALQPSTNVLPTNTAFWQKVGDYTSLGDAVAAQTVQISNLENGLGQAVTQTNALAVQLRGSYTGNDISLLSSGLIFQERQARATADSALATDITTLSAFVNTKSRVFYQGTAPVGTIGSPLNVGDLWIDTNITYAPDYMEGDYVIRSNRMYRWDGTAWVDAMDFGFADWFSAINIERTSRISGDESLASQITSVIALANSNTAAINQEITARANADSALTTQINTLSSTVNSNQTATNAAIQSESTARASADSALTTQINTLSSTVNSNNTSLTAAIQTESTARANADGTLFAQFTVKTDVNGYVSGFGLASTANNAAPTSSFIVRADNFLIGNPAGPSIVPATPFIVRTTATTIGGVSVPAGVYITDAFIQNGTISSAKIANLAVDNAKIASLDATKITSGFINADRIQAGSLDAKLANISAAVIGTGTLNIARIADAAITTAKIADAAITNAKIANLTVDNAKIANGAITTAKIGDAQITAAKIADAQITNAKIGNAQVDTLKLAGQAVTFSVGAYQTSTFQAGSQTSPADHIILTASTTCTGAPVNVHVAFMCRPNGDIDGLKGTNHQWSAQLIRIKDGVSSVVFTGWIGYARVRNTNTYGWGLGACGFNRRDTPGAGVVEYQLRVYNIEGFNGLTVFHRSMILSELKR